MIRMIVHGDFKSRYLRFKTPIITHRGEMTDGTEIVTLLSKIRKILAYGKFNRHDVQFIKETLEETSKYTAVMLNKYTPRSKDLLVGLGASGNHLTKGS